MKHLLARFLIFLVLVGGAGASPVTRNLGQGLAYHRVHQLPGDLPTAEDARRQPCILDLRYVTGGAAEAATLAAWLKFHATARAPVLVLANSATSAALLTVVAPRGPGASVVVLGAATEDFTPDIALKVAAADERRAYDALEHGTTADALIAENPDKPRNDEAKLAKDRQSDPAPTATADPSAPAEVAADPADKPKPLVDPVLQRAVQLHRALLALKKL